jgi:transcriptional regulator with XRE-family HTH domain
MFLSQLRRNANLSPATVAAELGISQSTLHRHERGLSRLNPLILRGYASYYGVLWTEIEQAKP